MTLIKRASAICASRFWGIAVGLVKKNEKKWDWELTYPPEIAFMSQHDASGQHSIISSRSSFCPHVWRNSCYPLPENTSFLPATQRKLLRRLRRPRVAGCDRTTRLEALYESEKKVRKEQIHGQGRAEDVGECRLGRPLGQSYREGLQGRRCIRESSRSIAYKRSTESICVVKTDRRSKSRHV